MLIVLAFIYIMTNLFIQSCCSPDRLRRWGLKNWWKLNFLNFSSATGTLSGLSSDPHLGNCQATQAGHCCTDCLFRRKKSKL